LKGKLGTDYATNDTIAASTTPNSDWTNVKGVQTNKSIPLSFATFTGSTMTVKKGTLKVSTLPTPIEQTIVAGTQGFNFANFSFDATASGEDVRLNSIQVEYNFGQPNSNDDLTNCQLWDGTTALNIGTNVVNGSNFDITADDKTFTLDQSLIIPKGTIKTLALKCNTAATTTQLVSNYHWTLEIPGDADDMIPTGVTSGSTITETYIDTTGQKITLTNGGTLAVSLDTSSSPAIFIASGNSTGNTVSAYRLMSMAEDIRLTQVGLMLASTASNTPEDLTKVSLWNGPTKLTEIVFTGDTATATIPNIPEAVISKGVDLVLTIKADIAAIGTSDPARPGHHVRVEIDPNAGDSLGDATQGIGLSSGLTIHATGIPSSSAGARIMKVVPTLTKLSLPSTTLVNLTIPLYRFSVTAPSSGNVGLYKFTYLVATSTSGTPMFSIKNLKVYGYSNSAFSVPAYANDGFLNSATTNGVVNTPNGMFEVKFDPVAQSGTPEAIQVPAGTTRYFELIGTVANMSATSSSVMVNLQGDPVWTMGTNTSGDNADNFVGAKAGNYAFTTTAVNVDFGTHDDFIWSDNATTTSGVGTYDWVNGTFLPGLPSTSMTSEILTP
jgi:hypothetical protein